MTVQKMIERIKWTMQNKSHNKEFCEGCIQALEELEQYRALGTVEEIIKHRDNLEQENHEYSCLGTVEELKEAMEKQIAKKPTDIDEDANTFVCPSCGHTLIALDDMTVHQHCLICGKALKWGEEDD